MRVLEPFRKVAIAGRRQPSAVLLFVQLAGVLLYPAMGRTTVGVALFSLFGIVVLALAVLAVGKTPWLTWVSLLIAGPAMVLLAITVFTHSRTLLNWSAGFESALYFYAAGSLLAYMLQDRRITRDELWAVGATFTLVAWAFANLFVVIQAASPGSFTAAVHPAADRSWMELLFLSFTTLTSTGLSDVVPIAGYARAVVMLEQLAGVMYVAMVISRLVGLTVRRDDEPT